MYKLRIQNDLPIRWTILSDNNGNKSPFDLSTSKVTIYLKSIYGIHQIKSFTVEGNVVRFVYRATDQHHCATYSLILHINEGLKGMRTVDYADAFALVRRSFDEEVGSDDNLSIDYLELKSSIKYIGTEFVPVEVDNSDLIKSFIDKISGLDTKLSNRMNTLENKVNSMEPVASGGTTILTIVPMSDFQTGVLNEEHKALNKVAYRACEDAYWNEEVLPPIQVNLTEYLRALTGDHFAGACSALADTVYFIPMNSPLYGSYFSDLVIHYKFDGRDETIIVDSTGRVNRR